MVIDVRNVVRKSVGYKSSDIWRLSELLFQFSGNVAGKIDERHAGKLNL